MKEKLKEAAPIGSFAYVQEKVSKAIYGMDSFDPDGDGDNDKYNCYICAIFPERVVITCEDAYFEMTYSIDADGNVTLGSPVEVEQYFTATESNAKYRKKGNPSLMEKELKESGIVITKPAVDMDFDEKNGVIHARIKEGSFNAETAEIEVIIIEAGTNQLKKRHYPLSTIREAAPIFTGMKMYVNHQTAKEENERPERDLRDWVSTIQESKLVGQAAVGRVYIHDPWLRERMSDPVFSKNVGLSINTGGKIAYGKINGEEMQIVEKINPTRSNGSGSVDWVTEAGARGRVIRPIKESAAHNEEINMKQVGEMTLEEFKAAFPAVYKNIQESAGQKNPDEKLAEANRVIEELTKEKKLRLQEETLRKLLKESKIPDVTKERIISDLKEKLFETEDKIKEAIKIHVEKELSYINSLSEKGKIKLPAGGRGSSLKEGESTETTDLKETENSLLTRFGYKSPNQNDD